MYSARLKTTNAYGSDGIADAAQYTQVSLRPKMLALKKIKKCNKKMNKKCQKKVRQKKNNYCKIIVNIKTLPKKMALNYDTQFVH